MASQLTEYERRRLENIKRNDEMMASLKIQSKLSEISTAKRQRVEKCKSYRIDPPRKEEKSNSPVVIRRSPRTRGLTPDSIRFKFPVKLPKPTVPSDSSDAISQTQGSQGPGFIESLVELREPLPQYIAPRPRGRPRKVVSSDVNAISPTQGPQGPGFIESLVELREPLPQYIAPRPRGRPRKVVPSDVNAISPTQGSQGPGFLEPSVELVEPLPRVLGSIRFRDSCSIDSESDARALTEAILSVSSSSSGSLIGEANGVRVQNRKASKRGISNSDCKFKLESLRLEPNNIARVVPGHIHAMKFFPTHDLKMVVVGNGFGDVGFWDMKSSDEVNCIHLHRLHSAAVSGILVHPFSMSKVYTSSFDGDVRVMNIEKQVFDLVYSNDNFIYSLAQKPDDTNSVYFGAGQQEGVVKSWDERMGKTSASWNLHEKRINSIDFNSANTNIMATSSTDGTACVWDLRKMSAENSVMLKVVEHKKSVRSAYFSPSGIHLASKSIDGNIGVISGKNFEDVSMILHDKNMGRSASCFRAVWGWDDTHLYVGSVSRGGVDVVSVGQKARIYTLRSKHVTSIPCWLDAHPWKAGALATAAIGVGMVYVWTPPS